MSDKTHKVKRKHGVLYFPMIFILVCAALVFGLSVFFRVSEIHVEGNRVYTRDEIIEASGIQEGDNLFFINRISVAARIRNKLSYIDTTSITRSFPNKIDISVTESKALAALKLESSYWAIDSSGKILAEISPADAAQLITIKGITPLEPQAGTDLKTEDKQKAALAFLIDILTGIENNQMESYVTYVNVEDVSSPSFDYQGRFIVKFGPRKDIEYKFILLLSAIESMAPGDSGTLDLSVDSRVHLTYS